MNSFRVLMTLSCLFLVSVASAVAADTQLYRAEYEGLKNSASYKLLVDDEASEALRGICRDIENYQELTFFQRIVRNAFMGLDVFAVTPRTMPKLHAYIDSMCKEQKIATPTIFVSTIKGFFNAAAQKLLTSSGAIVVGEQLLLELSDKELEAVVAHEIGHIKHNHINKMILISLAAYIPAYCLAKRYIGSNVASQIDANNIYGDVAVKTVPLYKRILVANIAASLLTALYINKSYEKQADEFAYKTMHKGEGLIGLFKRFGKKSEARESNLVLTGAVLAENKTKIGTLGYLYLNVRYYVAKAGKRLSDVYSWLYFHTPLGAHPSNESRIKAVQEHLAQAA